MYFKYSNIIFSILKSFLSAVVTTQYLCGFICLYIFVLLHYALTDNNPCNFKTQLKHNFKPNLNRFQIQILDPTCKEVTNPDIKK